MPHRLSTADYDAAIFDLDGVITETASLHFASWKAVFDMLLRTRDGPQARLFTEEDYREYVDGKPRLEGVESFLASRDIELPRGQPEDRADDQADNQTVWGLGNAKNDRYHRMLEEREIPVYEAGVELVETLRERGVRVAVVSSSRNCRRVLEQVGLGELFEARVDGQDLADNDGLAGKPAPDMFLEAARRLEVRPQRAIVFEDAEAGVEAGRAGEFGLVVGVARGPAARRALADRGADVVVESLGEFEVT